MLRFAHPGYLWALLLVPVLTVGFYALHRHRKQLMQRFVSEPLVAAMSPDASTAKRTVKQALLLLALACLIVAAANPQVGTRLEEVKREGIDLFVALDVSLSMKAEDIRPSRLEKAKRDVSDLLRKLQGDRVGLVVFAGEAYVQFPLTADYSAADLFLNAVDVEAVPVPGTMIGNAIEKALESFRKDLPTQKAIVVVSDGENTEGDIAGAVEKARKAGVRIFAVGMGTPEGNPIPVYGANGERVDYKHDRAGNIVLSKLDESALQHIALSTGGSYRRATNAGNEIDEIFNELSALQRTDMGSMQVTGFEDQFFYPLALGIFFLVIETLLSERRGRLLVRLGKLVPVARSLPLLLFLLCAATAHSQTVRSHVSRGNDAYEKSKYADAEAEYKKALQKDSTAREAQFNLGNAYYKQQRFDEAQRIYANRIAAAGKGSSDKELAYYDLGNTFFKANKLEEGIESYKRTLRLNPSDEDARYNYLLAKDRLKKQQEQKKQNKQDKNQQDKQDQQQNQNKDQQQKNDQQNQNQNQQQPPQQQQANQDQTKQQQQKNQMPKQQADRILDALRNNEKDIQKQLRKRAAARVIIEKDW
jgi:tetratricopeptide (TPR) repeat protein